MKKYLSGLITGIFLSLTFTALATELNILPNPYPVFFNGVKTEVEGYNINGYSFLKLADFKKIGLTIKFNETDEQIEVNSIANNTTQTIQSISPIQTNDTTNSKFKITQYNGVDAIEKDGIIYVDVHYLNLYKLNYDGNSQTITFTKNEKTITFSKFDENYCLNYNGKTYIKLSIIEN